MERVYFIQDITHQGPIKIGVSRNVEKRLKSLQNASPLKLKCLGIIAGGRDLERTLHIRFAPSRLHGEWFSPEKKLLQYIRKYAISLNSSKLMYRPKIKTTPISVPINTEVHKHLKRAATQYNLKTNQLAGHAIEEYVSWLLKQEKKLPKN